MYLNYLFIYCLLLSPLQEEKKYVLIFIIYLFIYCLLLSPLQEEKKLFSDFAEDFNTASFPHKKYYNLELWEAEERAKAVSCLFSTVSFLLSLLLLSLLLLSLFVCLFPFVSFQLSPRFCLFSFVSFLLSPCFRLLSFVSFLLSLLLPPHDRRGQQQQRSVCLLPLFIAP